MSNQIKIKKENLKQRAYLNSITSILDYGAKIVTNFVVTPFLINGLGTMLFGAWQILGQFTSYTSTADIQVTQVLKWAVAKDRGSKRDEELRQYVTATFLIMLLVVPTLLIVGLIISWYSPVITNVNSDHYSLVRITCGLLVLSLVTKKVFDVFESILRGMNIGFKRMGFRASIILLGGALKIVIIKLDYGLIELALVEIIISIIIGITIYFIVKQNVYWFGFGRINLQKSKSFFSTSWWFMGWNGTKMLLLNSDKILLGYLVGPVIVTSYVVTQYFSKTIQGVVTNVVHGVIPGIGKLYGNKEYDKLLKVREHLMQVTWIISVSIGIVILMFNQSFVGLWVSGENFIGQTVNLLVILISIQYIFIQNDSIIINTTLDIRKKVILGFISSIVSILIASILLINEWGVKGLCIGIILGRFILTISYPCILMESIEKKFNLSSIPVRQIIISILLIIPAWLLGKSTIINNWFLLIVSISVVLPLLALILFYIGVNSENRGELMEYFNKIKLLKKD